MSVVISGDFYRFKLAYRHCYSCQKTKSRLHIPISTVVHAEVVCAPKILPIGIFHSYSLQSEMISPWDLSQYQTPRAFRRKRAFSTCISKFAPLWLCSCALDNQTGHGRGRDLGTRSIFSLPRVVRSINVQYLPHSHRDTSP